jgi:hypothetical protein
VRLEELRFVCEEAARDLLAQEGRPVPPTVVLPGPRSTRLVRLPGFPDDEPGRLTVIDGVARDEALPRSSPAYGFIAEASVDGTDVLVAVYGAHRHEPRITAATFDGPELGTFAPDEALDPDAMPFLHPLQHAVDAAAPPTAEPGIPGFGAG